MVFDPREAARGETRMSREPDGIETVAHGHRGNNNDTALMDPAVERPGLGSL